MKRPYIIASIAMSIDGKIGTEQRGRIHLSSAEDLASIDTLRSTCDAILIGSTTLKKDNPCLVLKKAKGRDPMKVVISRKLHLHPQSNFFQKGTSKKLVFTTKEAPPKKIEELQKYAEVLVAKTSTISISWVLDKLFSRGVHRVLIEGGGETHAQFFAAGVVDELRVAIAPIIIGGKSSPTFVDGAMLSQFPCYTLKKTERLGNTFVLHYIK